MTKARKEKVQSYTTIFEPADEGGYIVHVPALPGCATQGDTFEEAQRNAQEAIEGHIAALRDLQEEIPIESEKTIISRIPAQIPA
jgi:predicted RNase H-like HicB family nuclease